MPSVNLIDASRASFTLAVGSLALAATPTDVLLMKGAAGKIIQIRRIFLSGLATTAGQMMASIIKRSTDNTGGTSTAPTGVPLESVAKDGAAQATFKLYTANPSGLGTALGTVRQRRLFFQLAGGGTPGFAEIDFGRIGNTKTLRLSGASEFLAINLGGGAVPAGGVLDIEMDWTEQ
jgi:hypothetical protein